MRATECVWRTHVPITELQSPPRIFFQTVLGSTIVQLITKSLANIIFKAGEVRHLLHVSIFHFGISELKSKLCHSNRQLQNLCGLQLERFVSHYVHQELAAALCTSGRDPG